MAKRKYTILGASGHIGSVICELLLAAGHEVRGVARTKARLDRFIQNGGIPVCLSFLDNAAINNALEGADAAFIMIPPDYSQADYRSFQNQVGETITQAIQKTKIPHIVNLSSVGAHLSEKTGPILGLHEQEKRLNAISSAHVIHLRPSFFMENHFRMIDLIKQQGIAGGALKPDLKIPMIATQDIGRRAAELLLKLDFSGKSTMELLGERDLSMQEVTPLLGKAIGKPDLKYVQFPYEGMEAALKQTGMSDKNIALMIEMNRGFNEGWIKPTELRTEKNTTPTSIEEFSKIFAKVYQG